MLFHWNISTVLCITGFLAFPFCKRTCLVQICSKNVYYLIMPVTILNWNTFHISTFCLAMVRVCMANMFMLQRCFVLSQSSDTENMINYTLCYQFCTLSRSLKSLIFQLHQSQHRIEEMCDVAQDTLILSDQAHSVMYHQWPIIVTLLCQVHE